MLELQTPNSLPREEARQQSIINALRGETFGCDGVLRIELEGLAINRFSAARQSEARVETAQHRVMLRVVGIQFNRLEEVLLGLFRALSILRERERERGMILRVLWIEARSFAERFCRFIITIGDEVIEAGVISLFS